MSLPLNKNFNIFLMLIIFLIPLSPLLPTFGFLPELRIDELALVTLAFIWLVKSLRENDGRIPFTSPELNTIFGWYLLCTLLPETINVLAGNTNVNLLTLLVFIKKIQYIILAQIVYSCITKVETAKRYVWLVIAASGVVALVGILQYLRVPFLDVILQNLYNLQSLELDFTAEGQRRITSVFPNPNSLTVYFTFISAVIFSLLSYGSMKKYHLALWVILVLDVLAIFLTGSRTGLFTFLVAILVVLIFKRQWKLMLGLGLMLTAYGYFMPEAFLQRIYNVVSISNGVLLWDKSFLGRLDGIARVVPIIQGNFLFGIGSVLKNSYPISLDQSYLVNLDSEYIRVLLSGGVMGLVMYIIFLGLTIKSLVQGLSRNNSNFTRALVLGILAGFTGLLVGDVVGTAFRTERLIDVFWVMLAIATALKNKLSSRNPDFWKRGRRL